MDALPNPTARIRNPKSEIRNPERTVRLDIEYEGTAYQGFARQANGRTIQAELEAALAATLQHPVRVVAAGRTDAGVHALGQVVSFRTPATMAPAVLQRALNARLPEDIAVARAVDERPGFDARHSARGRWYRYAIWRGKTRNVWARRHSYHVPGPLDLEAMRVASGLLVGRHDFRAFTTGWSKDARPGRRTWRTVYRADWTEAEDFFYFDIRADAFLRQMVRGIVGTLLWVGRGKLSAEAVAELLAGAARGQAGPNAPAHGLMLMYVDYGVADAAGEQAALARGGCRITSPRQGRGYPLEGGPDWEARPPER